MRHRGQQVPFDPERKRRTCEPIIADLSYNFLEWKVLQRGHWLNALRTITASTRRCSIKMPAGPSKKGEVRFQLKATDHLRLARGGKWVAQRVHTREVRYLCCEPFPVVVVVYAAEKQRAVWLHIRRYVDENPDLMQFDAKTLMLRIRIGNRSP